MLTHDDLFSLREVSHPHDDLEVIAIGQGDDVGQLIKRRGLEHDAVEVIFQDLSFHNRGVDVVEFSVHFSHLHLLSVYLVVDDVATAHEGCPENDTSKHLLSFPLNDVLAFSSEVVHESLPFFTSFETVLRKVVPEFQQTRGHYK